MPTFTQEELSGIFSPLDERSVLEELRQVQYTQVVPKHSSLLVLKLLCSPAGRVKTTTHFRNLTHTAYEDWMYEAGAIRPYHAAILSHWATVPQGSSAYPILLFNKDFADTRKIFGLLLTHEPDPPPYLGVILMNLFRQVLGLSHNQINALHKGPFEHMAKHYHELFSDHAAIEYWLGIKKQSLRFYGGATNTILHLYDGIFQDEKTGARGLERGGVNYDLGGGFDTSEIERLTNDRFISADIISPRIEDYDDDLVLWEKDPMGRVIVANNETRSTHMQKQRMVAYRHFDVFKNSFERDSQKYVVVSAGFMTSTVRPQRGTPAYELQKKLRPIGLSATALFRVMELVSLGKDVDLFTIQRATSHVYRYKTCFLQWRNGTLMNIVTTEDPFQLRRTEEAFVKIRELISPTSSPLLKYFPHTQ